VCRVDGLNGIKGRLMKCHKVKENIDEMIAGRLSERDTSEVIAHLECCQSCHAYLEKRQAMLSLLTRFPSHLVDTQAELASLKQSHQVWSTPQHRWAFGALAAGFAVFMVFWLAPFNLPEEDAMVRGVIAYQGETKTINFLFNSHHKIDNVRFSVTVPPTIELKGYAGKQQLTWRGKLIKGDNLLSIPIIAKGPAQSGISMSIEHENTRKFVNLMVDVRHRSGQLNHPAVNTRKA